MNQSLPKILLALAIGLVAACGDRFAAGQSQANDRMPQAEPLPQSSAAIEYVGPDTYILLDKSGQPQPVLGMSYEEFVAAWKSSSESMAGSPSRDLRSKNSASRASARASAELSLEIVIRSIAGGALKVPLGMSKAILLEAPQIESVSSEGSKGVAAKSFVSYDADEGGFVAWIEMRLPVRAKG